AVRGGGEALGRRARRGGAPREGRRRPARRAGDPRVRRAGDRGVGGDRGDLRHAAAGDPQRRRRSRASSRRDRAGDPARRQGEGSDDGGWDWGRRGRPDKGARMSEHDSTLSSRAEDFLALFNKGAEFTRELLKENQRLRSRLASVTHRQEGAARHPADRETRRRGVLTRIATLEEECTTARERLDQVELENSQFAQRYVEVEEENNNLANLYVSSYQLHSTLDLEEVIRIMP